MTRHKHPDPPGQRGYFTLAEFTALAGFSRQHLYMLWKRNRGPDSERITINKRPRRIVAFEAGMEWLVHHHLSRKAQAKNTFKAAKTAAAHQPESLAP